MQPEMNDDSDTTTPTDQAIPGEPDQEQEPRPPSDDETESSAAEATPARRRGSAAAPLLLLAAFLVVLAQSFLLFPLFFYAWLWGLANNMLTSVREINPFILIPGFPISLAAPFFWPSSTRGQRIVLCVAAVLPFVPLLLIVALASSS